MIEYTLPAFGWRMRPDPAFAVADISVRAPVLAAAEGQPDADSKSSSRQQLDVAVHICPLPNELATFVVLIAHLAVGLALGIATIVRQSPSRVSGVEGADSKGRGKGTDIESLNPLSACLPLDSRRAHRD